MREDPTEQPCPMPLATRLVELLDLRPDDLLIGLGLASFGACHALLERVPLRHQIVLVSPCAERPVSLRQETGIRVADLSVAEFARFPMRCNKIVIDGSLLATDGVEALLPLLFDRLESNGRLVIVLRAVGPPEAGAHGRTAAIGARMRASGFDMLFDTVKDPPYRYALVGGMKPVLA